MSLTYSYHKKLLLNLGNYSNIEVSIGADHIDPNAYDDIKKDIDTKVSEEYKKISKLKGKI